MIDDVLLAQPSFSGGHTVYDVIRGPWRYGDEILSHPRPTVGALTQISLQQL